MTIIAHRGASGSAPENTLAAFRRAIELGADAVEMDVCWSKDREIIVFHDDKLNRVTNGRGLVRAQTLAELKRLDAGSFFHRHFTEERIPTLREVIDLIGPSRLALFIEMKPGRHLGRGFEEQLAALLLREQMLERCWVMSFNHAAVQRVKEIEPLVNTLLLVGRRMRLSKLLRSVQAHKADGVSAKAPLASKAMIEALHEQGLTVVVWTVNASRQMTQLARKGVDGITSDFPERAIAALAGSPR